MPANLQYNAPYFDSTDPEERNNRQFDRQRVAACSSSRRGGTHEVKGGFEYFVSTRVGGNSQTSTGYVFQTDYKLDADGRPALDASGALIPRFIARHVAPAGLACRRAARRSTSRRPRSSSIDHWIGGAAPDVRPRPALRERQQRSDRRSLRPVDAQTLVPRLAAAFDLTG